MRDQHRRDHSPRVRCGPRLRSSSTDAHPRRVTHAPPTGNRFAAFAVFGGATLDHAAATLQSPVLGASNPGVARTSPGGVGLNVARDLARLGERVRLVSRIGDDADGAAVMAAIGADGIDTRGIATSADARTATYRAAFDDTGDLIIGIADMAVFDEIAPDTVASALDAAPAGEAFVVDANLPAATLAAIVARAANEGRDVAAIAVSPAKAVKLIPSSRG